MKKFSKILAVLLTVCLTITLAACSSYGKIEKAFKNAGYSVVESDKTESWETSGEEYGVTAHYLEKKETLSTFGVIILEFKATDDMLEFYENNEMVRDLLTGISQNEDAKDFYNGLVETGFANGNCMVFPASVSSLVALPKILEIVKNA